MTRCDFLKASVLSKVYVLQDEPATPITRKRNVPDLLVCIVKQFHQ